MLGQVMLRSPNAVGMGEGWGLAPLATGALDRSERSGVEREFDFSFFPGPREDATSEMARKSNAAEQQQQPEFAREKAAGLCRRVENERCVNNVYWYTTDGFHNSIVHTTSSYESTHISIHSSYMIS